MPDSEDDLKTPWSRWPLLQPLKEREFRLLSAGSLVSWLGDGMFFVAVVWQTYQISNVPIALSLVGAAEFFPQLCLLLLGGALSDRIDRRRLMIGADLLRGLAIGLLGLFAVFGHLALWHMIVLVGIYSVGSALFTPAATAILPQLVAAETLPAANAFNGALRPLCVRMAGPSLGGVLVALAGSGSVFLLDAVSFLASVLALAYIRPQPVPASVRQGLVAEIREGIVFVKRQQWLGVSLLASAIGLLFYMGPVQVLLPFRIKNELGGGPTALGLVFAAGGLGSLLGALAIGHFGQPKERLRLIYALWISAGALVMGYALASAVWQLVFVSFILMAALVAGEIMWRTLLQSVVPPRLLGRVSSLDAVVSLGLAPLSLLLAAPAAALWGVKPTMFVAGLCCALGQTLFFLLVPALRQFDSRPPAALVEEGLDGEAVAERPPLSPLVEQLLPEVQ